jgi:tetratricopeptide (TPR) repeat protein
MTSLIPGYEYDIFISYRQKDNKGDKWISEFVDALKDELESTFKEEISVYFDINPHDGLLETHDVDASLKEKLKCLVFIPILSRTYCDPKSFAWKNEFEVFAEQASHDQFGLKVKLNDGSIANRILPVRIHDLDSDDIKLCESVLGEALGGVEFIYKSSGVNRSLRLKEDKPHENLNNTIYLDQINKTALAIKQIILGLKIEPETSVKESSEHRVQDQGIYKKGKSAKSRKSKLLIGAGVLTILIIAGIFVYPKIFRHGNLDRLISKDGKISIAVMPFQNMTGDTALDVWQDGIQNNMISSLSNSENLKVRQMGTITGMIQNEGLTDYASLTTSVTKTISQKLETNVYILGSIKKSGSTLRVNAQLIDTKTGEAFKSFQIDGTRDSIFIIIDSLSRKVQEFLILSVMKQEVNTDEKRWGTTGSPEAFRFYMLGQKAFGEDFTASREWYLKVVAIDSNFIDAALQVMETYIVQGMYEQAKQWCLRYYKKRDMVPLIQKIWINYAYAKCFETPNEEIKCLKQLKEHDDLSPAPYFLTGAAYFKMGQYDKAIPELEKSLEIELKLESKPEWSQSYVWPVSAYIRIGQYKKAKKLLMESEKYFPDDVELTAQKATISLSEGDTTEANRYIEKSIGILKDNSASEASIAANLAGIYNGADIPDKAEKYLRQALSLEPEIPVRIRMLAFYLIDKDRNISEGLELIDKALQLKPDNYLYLDIKGWGLYKQGKYNEALALLEKADSLKPIYNHQIYLHLEAAKKEVASQN